MTSFADGIRQGIRNTYCSSLRTTEQFWGNFPSLLRPQPIAALARFWSGQYCNSDDPIPEFLDPQPELGQCAGVQYTVCASALNNFGNPVNTCRTGIGPFFGLSIIPIGGQGNVNLGFEFAGGRSNWLTLSAQAGENSIEASTIDDVTRTDGLPDDCGDIPDPLPQPQPIETTTNITYGDNNEFSLTTPIFFLPVINNFNGQLQIPFRLPNINIRGNINVTPDGEIDLDFDFPDPIPRPDGDDILPEPEPEDGDEIPEEPEDEPNETGDPPILAIFGKITTTNRTRATTIFQPGAPNIIAPRAGIVRFRIATGSGSAWSSDIPIKNQDFFIPCPAPWGAIDAIAVADTGVALEWGTLRGFTAFLDGVIAIGSGGSSDRRGETG